MTNEQARHYYAPVRAQRVGTDTWNVAHVAPLGPPSDLALMLEAHDPRFSHKMKRAIRRFQAAKHKGGR